MSVAAPEPKANMGSRSALRRRRQVTGRAEYAADAPLTRPAYAFLVTSSIAKGRIEGFDLQAARQVRGVIDIVTHENAERLKEAKLFSNGGYASTTIQPLNSPEIAQDGQIIAVVVADTYEAAREARHLVKVNYTRGDPDRDIRFARNDLGASQGTARPIQGGPKGRRLLRGLRYRRGQDHRCL